MQKKQIIFIVGPTASGKSAAAIRLAKKINGEIVSADSMQIYKGLDILSAKPTKAQQKQVTHHLIDIIGPGRSFNVNTFVRLAAKAIEDILERGKVPIVVGGTGFYIDALLCGIFKGPAKNAALRNKLEKQARRYGNDYLHDKLKKVDPDAAKKIHPHDLRRTIRALEVYMITKKPITQLQKERQGLLDDPRYDIRIYGMALSRQQLYENIDKRVDVMFRKGAASEVKRIMKDRLSKTFKQALGIKELAPYLSGETSLEEAKSSLQQNTRHFAKRQLTWFRRYGNIHWIKDLRQMSRVSAH